MGQQDIIGCFIPECFNTSEDPPDKRFVRVPCLPKLRQLWIKAGLRLKVKVPLVDKSPMYCCEDHFNLKNDATKQWLCSTNMYQRGSFIKLKRGVLPHIFPSKSKEYVKSSRRKIIRRRISTNEHENLKHELEQKLDLIDLTDSHESTSVDTAININQDELENANQNSTANLVNSDCGNEQENEVNKDNINRIEPTLDNESKNEITKIQSPVKHRRSSSDRSESDKDMLKEESENPKEKHQEEENSVSSKEHNIDTDKEVTLTVENDNNTVLKEEIENVSTGSSPIQNFEKNVLRRKRKMKKLKKRPKNMSFSQQSPDEEEEEFLLKEQANEEQSETDETKTKKKRTVVKEILAWIPSNTSNLPMSSPMQQPFLMVPTSTFPGLPNLHSMSLPIPAENDPQYVVSSAGRSSPQVQLEENKVVNFEEVTTEILSLKETMESLNKELILLRSDNVILKEQNIQIIDNRKKEEFKYDESLRLEIVTESLRPWFTPNQVSLLLDKPGSKSEINWNKSEMDSAAKLYNISPQAYKYVLESMKYPLPSIKSVRKYAEKKASPEKKPPWRECTNYELFNETEDSDEALVESMLEECNYKEKLAQNMGATGNNKWKLSTSTAEQDMGTVELQETLMKVNKTDKLGTSSQSLTIPGRRYEELPHTRNEIGIPPKIIRVPVQHSKGKNKGTSSGNNVLSANNCPQKIPLKPKIVKVGPPVKMRKISQNEEFNTKLKDILKARKEMKESLLELSQAVKQSTTSSIEGKNVLKIAKKNGPRCYPVALMDNSIEKQPEKKNYLPHEVLNCDYESIAEEFIENQDYHENSDKHISQVIMDEAVDMENVPQIMNTEDGSKVIRLQVNSLPGEDPTLYEEVVIHCDDPAIFDNEVVSLSFSHDDPMVDTAFL